MEEHQFERLMHEFGHTVDMLAEMRDLLISIRDTLELANPERPAPPGWTYKGESINGPVLEAPASIPQVLYPEAGERLERPEHQRDIEQMAGVPKECHRCKRAYIGRGGARYARHLHVVKFPSGERAYSCVFCLADADKSNSVQEWLEKRYEPGSQDQ